MRRESVDASAAWSSLASSGSQPGAQSGGVAAAVAGPPPEQEVVVGVPILVSALTVPRVGAAAVLTATLIVLGAVARVDPVRGSQAAAWTAAALAVVGARTDVDVPLHEEAV